MRKPCNWWPSPIACIPGCGSATEISLPATCSAVPRGYEDVTSVIDEARGRLLGCGPHATAQRRVGTMDNGTRDQLLGRLSEAIESV
ncbi:MAG: hypothetical protein QOC92_2453, partial [Acidimicrobiaceae bacterium]